MGGVQYLATALNELELLKEDEDSKAIFISLLSKLTINPPTIQHIPHNPYCPQEYQSEQSNIRAILMEVVGAIYTSFQRETGIRKNIMDEMAAYDTSAEFFLYERALHFAILNSGNCSHRSAYAALQLVRILKSDVRISLSSNPKYDHFFLRLTDPKTKKSFIYDPLSNPELLFDEEYYTEQVLPTFAEIPEEKKIPQYHYEVNPVNSNKILVNCQLLYDLIRRKYKDCSTLSKKSCSLFYQKSHTDHIYNGLKKLFELEKVSIHITSQNKEQGKEQAIAYIETAVRYIEGRLNLSDVESGFVNFGHNR